MMLDFFKEWTAEENAAFLEVMKKRKIAYCLEEDLADVRKDIDHWSTWNDYGSMSVEEMAERKQGLIILCDNLEKRIL